MKMGFSRERSCLFGAHQACTMKVVVSAQSDAVTRMKKQVGRGVGVAQRMEISCTSWTKQWLTLAHFSTEISDGQGVWQQEVGHAVPAHNPARLLLCWVRRRTTHTHIGPGSTLRVGQSVWRLWMHRAVRRLRGLSTSSFGLDRTRQTFDRE